MWLRRRAVKLVTVGRNLVIQAAAGRREFECPGEAPGTLLHGIDKLCELRVDPIELLPRLHFQFLSLRHLSLQAGLRLRRPLCRSRLHHIADHADETCEDDGGDLEREAASSGHLQLPAW